MITELDKANTDFCIFIKNKEKVKKEVLKAVPNMDVEDTVDVKECILMKGRGNLFAQHQKLRLRGLGRVTNDIYLKIRCLTGK